MKKLMISTLLVALSMNAMAQEAAKAEEAAAAGADKCAITISGDDAMKFDVKEFSINKSECPEFTVTLKHVGKLPAVAMGHNVVVTKKADMEAVAKDAIAAGPAKEYIKEGDERIVAHTKLIGGGQEDSVTFKTEDLEAGTEYEFFCSFPGHYAVMKGGITVSE